MAQRAFQQQLAVRRAYHEKIINKMVDPEFAVKIRLQALQRISVWRDEQTCSEFYCRTWENILAMPSIDAMKEAVLLDKNWSNALQQNSPISGWNLEGAE